MFRCEKCNSVVPPGTAAHSLIVQQRRKEYPTRTRDISGARGNFRTRTIDRGGSGAEIVRELKVCPECAEQYSAAEAPPPPAPEESIEEATEE